MNKYIGNAGKSDLYEDTEILTVNDCMEEFMFLGLRMMKGVSSRRFLKLFNKNINDVYAEPLEENIKIIFFASTGMTVVNHGIALHRMELT